MIDKVSLTSRGGNRMLTTPAHFVLLSEPFYTKYIYFMNDWLMLLFVECFLVAFGSLVSPPTTLPMFAFSFAYP